MAVVGGKVVVVIADGGDRGGVGIAIMDWVDVDEEANVAPEDANAVVIVVVEDEEDVVDVVAAALDPGEAAPNPAPAPVVLGLLPA